MDNDDEKPVERVEKTKRGHKQQMCKVCGVSIYTPGEQRCNRCDEWRFQAAARFASSLLLAGKLVPTAIPKAALAQAEALLKEMAEADGVQ